MFTNDPEIIYLDITFSYSTFAHDYNKTHMNDDTHRNVSIIKPNHYAYIMQLTPCTSAALAFLVYPRQPKRRNIMHSLSLYAVVEHSHRSFSTGQAIKPLGALTVPVGVERGQVLPHFKPLQ